MDPIKEKIKSFSYIWKYLEMAIVESFVQVFNLEIADKTPEQLLQKVVETMESKGCSPNIDSQEQIILLKALWKLKGFLDGPLSKTFNISRYDV